MTKDSHDRVVPKRGAFPTPKKDLDEATPYVPGDIDQTEKPGGDEPEKPESKVDPSPESDSPHE